MIRQEKKSIVFDFDGVIHPNVSDWQGISKAPDPPNLEVVETIRRLHQRGFKVIIQSARCSVPAGLWAIKNYIKTHNIYVDDIVAHKPAALCYVDDRSICFTPGMNLFAAIMNFKPWSETATSIEELNDTEGELLT